MANGGSLDPEQRRKSLVMCYVTASQKAEVIRFAEEVRMTQSDLVRLLLVTATPEDVERLKQHPDYLALMMEESTR